jgi:phosphomannomutase
LNAQVAYRIGRAFAEVLGAESVVLGRDVRPTSSELERALAAGLRDAGARVYSIGECGTEMVYFATDFWGLDGGIMVTASHNPRDYNGLKLVREGARPVSGDSGLTAIRERAEALEAPADPGVEPEFADIGPAYRQRLLAFIDRDRLRPLKVVSDPGNGGAGPVMDALAAELPVKVVPLHHAPDGTFPNGIPNPLLPENRAATAQAVVDSIADLGIAWDGDFDRCFLFDEHGAFVEGYYLVGLLAQAFLRKHPGERIIYDPRLTWNTEETVHNWGGVAVKSKTGHAFIKERMRAEDAIYGGEMSGHHYFRDFAYCDSGMVPWLKLIELMGETGQSLSDLVAEQRAAYPCSGEINFEVADPGMVMERIVAEYGPQGEVDRTDGVGVDLPEWRFNLRGSNTEPLLRLNVEARGDERLMEAKTAELSQRIRGLAR